MGTISLCVLGLPVCEFLAVPARMRTGAHRTHTAIGFDRCAWVRNRQECAPGERSKWGCIIKYGYNDSPPMHTGSFEIPVRVLWLIGDKSLYAYGDSSTEPATHTGIVQSLTVCIMLCLCVYGKLGIWSPYAKVCIWGLPYAYGQWLLRVCIRGGESQYT
jgi:hypothetical protein